jgi:hypothetical protein
MYAIVPLAAECFDRERDITTLRHMIEDFEVARDKGAAALSDATVRITPSG